MYRSRIVFAAALCCLVSACSYKPGFISEYKIDIQQGNVLTQDMVAQLKPGQTREQVRFILGSPTLSDIFHQWRWDYPYSYRRGSTGQTEMRRLSVFFDNEGRLERLEGNVEAVGEDVLATPTASSRLVDLGSISAEEADKPLPPREPPGFFSRVMENLGFGGSRR